MKKKLLLVFLILITVVGYSVELKLGDGGSLKFGISGYRNNYNPYFNFLRFGDAPYFFDSDNQSPLLGKYSGDVAPTAERFNMITATNGNHLVTDSPFLGSASYLITRIAPDTLSSPVGYTGAYDFGLYNSGMISLKCFFKLGRLPAVPVGATSRFYFIKLINNNYIKVIYLERACPTTAGTYVDTFNYYSDTSNRTATITLDVTNLLRINRWYTIKSWVTTSDTDFSVDYGFKVGNKNDAFGEAHISIPELGVAAHGLPNSGEWWTTSYNDHSRFCLEEVSDASIPSWDMEVDGLSIWAGIYKHISYEPPDGYFEGAVRPPATLYIGD